MDDRDRWEQLKRSLMVLTDEQLEQGMAQAALTHESRTLAAMHVERKRRNERWDWRLTARRGGWLYEQTVINMTEKEARASGFESWPEASGWAEHTAEKVLRRTEADNAVLQKPDEEKPEKVRGIRI